MTNYLKIKHILTAICGSYLIAGQITAHAQTEQTKQADHIVAIVNSEPITHQEVTGLMTRVRNQMAQNGTAISPSQQLYKEMLERLISERAQIQYAKENGLDVDEETLQSAQLTIAHQNQLQSVEELHKRLKADGISVQEFKDNIKNQVLLGRIRERDIEPKIQITTAEIDKYIREQTGQIQQQDPEINLAMILIAQPETADEKEKAKYAERANDVMEKIKSGRDFDLLAAEYSDANGQGQDGGVLGLRPSHEYPDLFINAIKNQKEGAVVGPIKSDAGYHIIKLLERKTNQDLPEVVIPQTHAKHILLKTEGKDGQKTAAARAAGILKRIKSGKVSFEEMARQYSQDSSASQGGDLGWAIAGQFVPEFETAMNNLKEGEISQPVASRFGVHLIKVEERRQQTLSSEEQRQLAGNVLKEQKAQRAFEEWAQNIRENAHVQYKNQTNEQ